jgi:hypothetical protein
MGLENAKQFHQLEHEAINFSSDDYIAIDGQTNATRKMSNVKLINIMSQNAIAGNIAPAFNPSSSYIKDQVIAYDGKLYKFTNPHAGSWNPDDAVLYTLEEETPTVPVTDQYINSLFSDF